MLIYGVRDADASGPKAAGPVKGIDIRDLGDRVLVLGHVRGRGRVSGAEVDDRWAWIVELREGRAASLRGFLDHLEALEAAGLRE